MENKKDPMDSRFFFRAIIAIEKEEMEDSIF